MRQIYSLYEDENSFAAFLFQNHFNTNQRCVARVFTTFNDDEYIKTTVKEIRRLLPKAKILGATSEEAIIFNAERHENATMIILTTFNNLDMHLEEISTKEKSFSDISTEVYNAFSPYIAHGVIAHIWVPYSDWHMDSFVEHINMHEPVLPLVGGLTQKIFTEKGILEDTIIAMAFVGVNAHYFAHPSIACEPISKNHTITKGDTNHIVEIDNKPIADWLCAYFDIARDGDCSTKNLDELLDYLKHFIFLFGEQNQEARYVFYNTQENKFSILSTDITPGISFKVGYITPKKVIDETYKLCNALLSQSTQALFMYNSMTRHRAMKDSSDWELTPFKNHNLCGIFMLGEICFYEGHNLFFHGANCFTAIAEEDDQFILPNTAMLSENEQLVQNDFYFKKAAQIQEREHTDNSILGKDTQEINEQNRVDSNTGIPNLFQYESDLAQKSFDKIAILEVISADTLIAFSGQTKYYEVSKLFISLIKAIITKHNLDEYIHVYFLNYKNLIISCSDAMNKMDFIHFMQKIHAYFERSHDPKIASIILRFVVVVDQNNMMRRALNILAESHQRQDSFILSEEAPSKEVTAQSEVECIELLSLALEHHLVTPYYQGIRDNTTGEIDKYESLMRIIDLEGKVHYPNNFLDVSKRYLFYNRLSQMMIARVLNDFEHRTESVSINISLFDIESDPFKNWLLARLQRYPDPYRVIIEIVETESVQGFERMKGFIEAIHEVGSRIAIDDFGAGYSTFLSLAKVSPDILKIDGSIIQEIATDKKTRVLLDAICYLAKKLNIQTVAEFVDTAEVQAVIERYGVQYSQGFYFAKPVPLSQLPKE